MPFLVLVVAGLFPAPCLAAPDFDQGLEAAHAGDLDTAIHHWTATIKRAPRCYEAYVNRGTAYFRKGNVIQGVRDWHKARVLSPTFAYATDTGDFINILPQPPRSLGFVKTLELDPEFAGAVTMSGATYLDLGQRRLAAELFRKAVELTKNPVLKNDFDYWRREIESKRSW
ncbi:MAG: tetratricopeptide repeat protein [Thermodesulfobacteriota bacterium]